MSTDTAAGWQDDLPYGTDIWDIDFADPAAVNFFSAEIENVNASDWDVDAAQIWGDETDNGGIDDSGGLLGADFTL